MARLETIMRQMQTSSIVYGAHEINKGKVPGVEMMHTASVKDLQNNPGMLKDHWKHQGKDFFLFCF